MTRNFERNFVGSTVACGSSSVCSMPIFDRVRVNPESRCIEVPLKELVETGKPISEKERRKPFKAECNAQHMLMDHIGFDQWKVYRETNLVAVKGHFIWLIGDYFKRYDKSRPFSGKPDVIRIDKPRIWKDLLGIRGTPATSFCVETKTREQYPYTDKVVAFMVQCAHEEKEFYKMANRIEEFTIKKMPRCALYEGD